MELAGYFAIARRWWLVLAASVVLASAAGYAVASQLPKVYEAEVRLLVGPLNTDLDTQRAAGQLAQTYAQLVTSQRVTEAVIRELGLNLRPAELQDAMTAVPNDVTRLVVVRVSSHDAQVAAAIANAVAEELSLLGAASGRPEGQTQVIDAAEAPTAAASPRVSLIVLLAALAGFLAAISSVILIEYVRDLVRSEDDVRELSGVPTLGTVPTRMNGRGSFASALLSSPAADRYRLLTARVEASFGETARRTLLVAGVPPDGSVGIVAAGLALGFADRGMATALVDANSAAPDATRVLGLQPVPELDRLVAAGQVPVSHLSVTASAGRAVPPRQVGLSVVASGSARNLGKAEHLETILDRLTASAEVVVISAPPLDRSPEGLLWARLADAIVLVVPYPGARRRDLTSSVDALRLAGLELLGTILTEPRASGGFELGWRRPGSSRASPASTSSVAKEILAPRETGAHSASRSHVPRIPATGDPDATRGR